MTWYQSEWKDERPISAGSLDDEKTRFWLAVVVFLMIALYYWSTSLCHRPPPVALQVPVVTSPSSGDVSEVQRGVPLAHQVFVKKWRFGGWTEVEYS